MRRAILLVLILVSPMAPLACDDGETPKPKLKKKCEELSPTRDATVLSIMGWGIAIAVGIATLCALLDNNSGSSTTTPTTPGT